MPLVVRRNYKDKCVIQTGIPFKRIVIVYTAAQKFGVSKIVVVFEVSSVSPEPSELFLHFLVKKKNAFIFLTRIFSNIIKTTSIQCDSNLMILQ